ncbi:hypothetical protein GJ496_006073 [Pomphorhynchus laevis]|nr:hypothetical protein GJ496_006073 [Pomphorhynchus laevis]
MWKRLASDANSSQMSPSPRTEYVGRSIAAHSSSSQGIFTNNKINIHTDPTITKAMNDNIRWVTTQPSSKGGDGQSIPGAYGEKFQIKINTQGFQMKDIDVFTKNRKLHINAFRQELNASGAKITNRLERSYDIPYDAEISAMSVKFPTDSIMVVEFPVNKPILNNLSNSVRYPVSNSAYVRPASSFAASSTMTMSRAIKTSEAVSKAVQRYPIAQAANQASPYIPGNISNDVDRRHNDERGQMHKATLVNVKTKEPYRHTIPESTGSPIHQHDSTFNKYNHNTNQINTQRPNDTSSRQYTNDILESEFRNRRLNKSRYSLGNIYFGSNPVDTPVYPKIVRDEQTGKNKMTFSLEVHGFEPSDFRVSVNNNNRLLIEAKHVDDTVTHSSNGGSSGSRNQYFRKEVTLPTDTDVNRLRTQLIDGYILEVEAPVLESQWISVPIERNI